MSLKLRVALMFAMASVALAAQGALLRHLRAAGSLPAMPLSKPLKDFPTTLGTWDGQNEPIRDPQFLYADEHLHRRYRDRESGQTATLWMASSARGADRGHHPEVCMAVAGKPEDKRFRQSLVVDGDGQPIQQYCFGTDGEAVWIFYWHYTLPTTSSDRLDVLQRLYQQRHGAPSVTIEVFASQQPSADLEVVRELVSLVDAAVRDHVGREAVRGTDRMPVTLIDDGVLRVD